MGLIPFFIVLSAALGFLTLQGMEGFGLLALLGALGGAVILLRPQLGMLVFLSTFFMTYGRLLPTEGRFTPNNLLGLLFAVLLLVKLFQERDLWFLKEKAIQVAGLLVIVMLISSHLAEQRFGNPIPQFDLTEPMRRFLVTRFILLIFFVSFIRSYRDVKLVLVTVIAFILIAAVSGLRGAVAGVEESGREYVRATAEAGIQAAGNANRLAFFAEVAIALLWYYPQEGRSRWLRLLRMAMIPGLAATVLLAASRSGLVNLVLLFGLLVLGERFSVKRQLQTVLVLSLAAYLAVSLVTPAHIERLENLFPGGSITARGTRSVEGRIETLQIGLREMIAREPLFGIGLGNFMWVHLQISGRRTPPHNSYLWAAAEGGIPTLLLYLLLFGLTFKNLVQVERKARHPGLREVARGLRTSLLVFLSFSFFAEFWHNIIAYVLVGLAIVLRRLQEAEPVTMPERALQADAPDALASRGAGVSLA